MSSAFASLCCVGALGVGFPSLLAYEVLRARIAGQPWTLWHQRPRTGVGSVAGAQPSARRAGDRGLRPVFNVVSAGTCTLPPESRLRGDGSGLPPPPCGLHVAFLPGVPPPAGGFGPLKRTSVLGDRIQLLRQKRENEILKNCTPFPALRI